MVSIRQAVLAGLLAAAGTTGVFGADNYRVTATIGAQTASAGFGTTEQTFDALTESGLRALLPGYTGIEATSIRIDYRGLSLLTAYPEAESTALVLDIQRLGINEVFEGSTREESRRLLRDYFKNSDALGRIMRALAEVSPTDPLAGNPASLQSRMVSGSFQRHFGAVAGGRPGASAAERQAEAGTLARGTAGRQTRAGLSSTTVGVPFSYALPIGPQRPLSVDGELQYASTEGAQSYGLQLGLAYRLAMGEGWALVPALSVGATASPDLGSAGTMVSASLTSALRLVDRGDFALWMGNGLNHLRSVASSAQGYRFDPQLRNTAMTNGLMASWAPAPLGPQQWLELGLSDTRYYGSALYDERSNELSLAWVRASPSSAGITSMRAELAYQDSTHSRGWGVRVQLAF